MPAYRIFNGEQMLCCTVDELSDCGVNKSTIKKGLCRYRSEGSCWPHHKEGRKVFIHYAGLKPEYKNLVKNIICRGEDPEMMHQDERLEREVKSRIDIDGDFFNNYRTSSGDKLHTGKVKVYKTSCAVLRLMSDHRNREKVSRIGYQTVDEFTRAIIAYIKRNRIQLPTSYPRLVSKLKEFRESGPQVVIKGYFGNQNRLKVDADTERLLMSLFVRDEKPYYTVLHSMYNEFRRGHLSVADLESGEMIDHHPWTDKEIGITTIWNWINDPDNRSAADKLRTSGLEFNSRQRSHMHRHSPVYALSKITVDDIDIPFKLADGTRVKAYEVYDVASGCVIGRAYSKKKDTPLFTEAIRDMLRLIIRNRWKMPYEVETERHIAWNMKGKETETGFESGLLTAGELFPYVHFCRGGNPQEKRAEHLIKGKKYGVQAMREGFQRRPFARLEANRMNEDKNRTTYTFDEICRHEDEDIETWNQGMHPDQELYPDMTRWQVLCENQNPSLSPPIFHVAAWYAGFKTEVTVQRNQYVTVRGQKYMFPDPETVFSLKSLKVTVCFLEKNGGDEVYIYQNDRYVCSCKKLRTYNEAVIEQTDEDREIMQEQFIYRSKFDKLIKDKVAGLRRLKIINDPVSVTRNGEGSYIDEYDVPAEVEIRESGNFAEIIDEYDL